MEIDLDFAGTVALRNHEKRFPYIRQVSGLAKPLRDIGRDSERQ
jgi:hypothetical protein